MRSISIGTQPIPPSENATRISGKRVGMRAHSQSAAAAIAFTENSDVYSSSGAPGERAAVHDADAGLDVVAAAPHLVEARGLHAPLGLGPARHRVESDLRVEALLVHPGLAAVVERDDERCLVGEGGRHASFEDVGRLDEVI